MLCTENGSRGLRFGVWGVGFWVWGLEFGIYGHSKRTMRVEVVEDPWSHGA